ncbi:MAG TPA: ABC transporter ATP-binding protein [Mycobacteriales bacterium]|nr:ABC transporter ATP-binding protein [Mycobacteriales bacterium]
MTPPPPTAVLAGGRVVRRGFAILGRSIREEPRLFAFATLGASIFAATTVASAVVLGIVTDRAIIPAFDAGRPRDGALWAAGALLLGVAVVKSVGLVLRRVGASLMQTRLQATYRRRVTRQYLRLPLSWHHQHSTGELLSNAHSDIEAVFYPIAPLPFSVGVVVMLVIASGVLVVTDPVLAAVGFVVFPALAGLNVAFTRQMQPKAMRAQQLRGEVSSVAHESIDGALVVKTLGRETAETDRFREVSDRLRDEMVGVSRVRALFDPLMDALPNVGVLLVVFVGAYRVRSGAVDAGDVVRIAYLFTLLAIPIRGIGWVLADLPRSVVGWDRVSRVLDADGALPYGDAAAAPSGLPAHVEVDSVSFAYDDADVLHDVSFTADDGRTIAVVGPTGSGKSTAAALLVRLADPRSGEVRLDGADLRDLRQGAVPAHAAVVFQESFLFDDTVRGNLTLGADVPDRDVEAAAKLAQAHDFIRALPNGYDTLVGERGTTLSGGQRQRIALARALVRRPRLLVLDDATSSVDPSVEAAILHGLRDAELPSTVVVVAYRQATIALADEVVYVHAGRIVDRGSHAELLLRQPGYARLVTAYDDVAADPEGTEPTAAGREPAATRRP